MGARLKIEGKKFGYWTVLHHAGNRNWVCRCICGVTKPVLTCSLTSGKSTNCGCKRYKNTVKHNGCGTREYRSWDSMKQRCNNPNATHYDYYGGRGISICTEWVDFSVFLADMGKRPTPTHTLDRIDTNGNYNPDNCKWVTRKEQARNRRDNRLIYYRGLTLCVIEWCERLKIDEDLFRGRLKLGWTIEEIINTPVLPQRRGRETNKLGQFVKQH